eukprot:TRINITY_DN3451_c0_g1_i1.p1 TRINITY_DN3451_c0_g1~~TRINITY_DN3451_c0_g1_i1.p1  ORF type:complete len:360 (-),score=113.24 TRINITY_DN3451_c0_g1_i1:556-1635(-)
MGATPSSHEHIEKYKYAEKKMPYRSEKLIISKSEKKTLDQWIESSLEAKDVENDKEEWSPTEKPVKVIFDTDIGTDVDDALALLFLLHLPKSEVELMGVTTVYGHTNLRAKVASAILDAYQENSGSDSQIPVFAGEGIPIGTHRPVWHTGTEGVGLFDLKQIDEMKLVDPGLPKDRYKAAKFIVETVNEHPGDIVLIGLGALTNIAIALKMDPNLPKLVKRFTYMGMGHRLKESQSSLYPFQSPDSTYAPGNVYVNYPNHNLSSDTMAAVRAFQSDMTTYVVNDAVTNKLWFNGPACKQLCKSRFPPENKVVGNLLGNWLYYRTSIFFKEVDGTCPHDALAVSEIQLEIQHEIQVENST